MMTMMTLKNLMMALLLSKVVLADARIDPTTAVLDDADLCAGVDALAAVVSAVAGRVFGNKKMIVQVKSPCLSGGFFKV